MNKKIKIIDLVNRIESGEKVPEKIKYNQLEFKYDKGSGKYIRKNSSIITWFCIERFTNDFLNKTVEILEDNTEQIEELYIDTHKILSYDREESKGATVICFKLIIDEINRLKVAINQLRKDKSND